MACRKSILFNDGRAWIKKEKNFDVTMGAQDGAEIAELTGIYLLQQINKSLSKMEQKPTQDSTETTGLSTLRTPMALS